MSAGGVVFQFEGEILVSDDDDLACAYVSSHRAKGVARGEANGNKE